MSDRKRGWILLIGTVCLGIFTILGGVAYAGLFGDRFSALGLGVLLSMTLPIIGCVFVSLIYLGVAAPYAPLVPRGSLLWSWLNFMSKGSAGVLLLVSGSLIGGLLGAQVSRPDGDWVAIVGFVAALIFIWLMVVVAIWTLRAGVDIARLGKQRKELLHELLTSRGSRNAGRTANIMSISTELTAVALAGLALLYLLAVAYLALGRGIGFYPIS